MNELRALQIQPTRGIEIQIQEYVRGLITAGRLKPGTKLPATAALAELWGAGSRTVQKALTPLVKEGLLVRRTKSGTFVQKRAAGLTCVGVYHTDETRAHGPLNFDRAVQTALKEQLHQRGVRVQFWIDPRRSEVTQRGIPWSEICTAWPELSRAAQTRQIQALISIGGGPHLAWQNKLPIPSAHLTSAEIPNGVGGDFRQLAEEGVRALAAQGCRSVGLILYLGSILLAPQRTRPFHQEFLGYFIDAARDLGLTVRNDWVRMPRSEDEAHRRRPEQFGYEETLALWGQRERPAGLLVPDDVVARGVILAVRERQVRVPAELKLVLHKNETIDLFCPMPVTFAVLSERECAAALIAQIEKQFRGERCAPVLLPFQLQAHPAPAR